MLLSAFEDDLSFMSIFQSCDSSNISAVEFNLQVCSMLISTVAMAWDIFSVTPLCVSLFGFVKGLC
jgi:hypothetical protein